jgi:hypothetical protein
LAPEPAAPRRNSRRGEERISFRCRRVYFGTALRRDVAVVFAPSGVTIEWRSEVIGLYIEARLTPSNMTSFDMYHGPGGKCGSLFSLLYDEKRSPDAIREFFAIGLREKPRCLIDGFEPTDEEGSGKYVVVVLEGDALATFKRKVVPAVVWGGHIGWPAAPVLSTPAAARLFLEGVPIADALAAGGAPAAHSGIARTLRHSAQAPAAGRREERAVSRARRRHRSPTRLDPGRLCRPASTPDIQAGTTTTKSASDLEPKFRLSSDAASAAPTLVWDQH